MVLDDEIIVASEKFFAPVQKDGQFSVFDLKRKKKDVFITPSDAKYGGVMVCKVVMSPLEGDAPDGDSNGELWRERKIAWVWQNFDGSYWLDTLSWTKDGARNWTSNPERIERIGSKLVAVQFSVVN